MAEQRTLFQKIADGDVPADMVYEDEDCFAFRDINPQAPTHILIVPRKVIPSLNDVTEADERLVGHLFTVARKLAADEGLSDGYRTVFNCGVAAGQSVITSIFICWEAVRCAGLRDDGIFLRVRTPASLAYWTRSPTGSLWVYFPAFRGVPARPSSARYSGGERRGRCFGRDRLGRCFRQNRR